MQPPQVSLREKVNKIHTQLLINHTIFSQPKLYIVEINDAERAKMQDRLIILWA